MDHLRRLNIPCGWIPEPIRNTRNIREEENDAVVDVVNRLVPDCADLSSVLQNDESDPAIIIGPRDGFSGERSLTDAETTRLETFRQRFLEKPLPGISLWAGLKAEQRSDLPGVAIDQVLDFEDEDTPADASPENNEETPSNGHSTSGFKRSKRRSSDVPEENSVQAVETPNLVPAKNSSHFRRSELNPEAPVVPEEDSIQAVEALEQRATIDLEDTGAVSGSKTQSIKREEDVLGAPYSWMDITKSNQHGTL
ncbi:hypothetical protein QBC35DRAFT_471565 [Podospora australis]|uniref:Uncharacterized protein n=1 Tax=Podospora australis TaxID=1536484 RepID=A0AAN7AJ76_9PEZI|nr:hypothetical protein QBC35DRAFT_471565 [Podospora australis]